MYAQPGYLQYYRMDGCIGIIMLTLYITLHASSYEQNTPASAGM